MTRPPETQPPAEGAALSELERVESERRQTDRRLIQAQKLEAVGRLAGGVAHDFNNLLSVVVGNAELLASSLGAAHPDAGLVREIIGAAERGAALTRKLLAFGRRQVVEPQVFAPAALLLELERILRRVVGEDVRLEVRCAAGSGTVRADPGQLEQAVMDLAVNSREAMPAGGTLTVSVDELEVGSVVSGCREPVRPGRYVRIAVADTGAGMSEEVSAHAFEPFYSTKEFGSGLGLASVHGIVHQSSGYVAIESAGSGTTVLLYLPRVDAAPETAPVAAPVPVAGAGATVLLVEDEAAVRELTTRLLRLLGYRVLVAQDGEEALAVAATEPGPIAALVTDVVMPGLSGPELARELERVRPGLPTLFVSGYAHDAAALDEVLASGGQLLSKPFGRAQLGRALAEVLGANRD